MTAETPVSLPPSPPMWLIKILNGLISALLRSPLHGILSKSTIVLSFRGKKTGRVYTFPVGYYDLRGDTLIVIPLHEWWKNLRGNVPVELWLKGRHYQGVADASQSDEATVREMERIIRESSNLMRVFKIPRDSQGQPEPARTRQVARALSLVRIRLTPLA